MPTCLVRRPVLWLISRDHLTRQSSSRKVAATAEYDPPCGRGQPRQVDRRPHAVGSQARLPPDLLRL
jgi:hypothetical protein